jgi:hypothetical protein
MKSAKPIASHHCCFGFFRRPLRLFLGERAKGIDFRIDFVKTRIYRIDHFDRRHFLLANGRGQGCGWCETEVLSIVCSPRLNEAPPQHFLHR